MALVRRPPGRCAGPAPGPWGFLGAQVLELLGQVGTGLFLELGDADVADAVVQHLAAHAAHLDDVAHDLQHDGLGTIGAHDGQRDRRLGRAAHELDRFVQRHALGGRVVDLDDEVAGHHAGARRACPRWGNDLDEAVLGADLDAQAAELALRGGLHFAEGLGVQVGRVRIQVGHHAGDRVADERLVINRFDIVVLDRGEDVAQLPELVQGSGLPRWATADTPTLSNTPATAPVAISPKPRNLRVPMHTSRILFSPEASRKPAGCPTDVPTSGCQ